MTYYTIVLKPTVLDKFDKNNFTYLNVFVINGKQVLMKTKDFKNIVYHEKEKMPKIMEFVKKAGFKDAIQIPLKKTGKKRARSLILPKFFTE